MFDDDCDDGEVRVVLQREPPTELRIPPEAYFNYDAFRRVLYSPSGALRDAGQRTTPIPPTPSLEDDDTEVRP